MAEYRVLMVNRSGVPYAELANANVEEVSWELNGIGGAAFSLNTRDPQVGEVVLLTREVQIWRNGTLVQWAVPVAATADAQRLRVTCAGLLWYFSRRFLGPVGSAFVANGSFESDFTSWTPQGSITNTVSTTTRLVEAKAAKLVNGTPGAIGFVTQNLGATLARSLPTTYTLSAWVYVQTFISGSPGDRGLYLQATGSSTREVGAPLNAATPVGRWTRLECSVVVPPGAADSFVVRLYVPEGTVYWDEVRMFYDQRTGAAAGEDYNKLAERLVRYAAGIDTGGGPGTAVFGASIGKTSLSMDFAAGAAAGALPADRYFDHADNPSFYDALRELPARNVLDFEVTWNAAGTTRTFRTYAPRKGTTKAELAIELGRNLDDFRYDANGAQTANAIRVVGRSNGEVAIYDDTSALGGLQLDGVVNPAQELDPQGIIDLAPQEHARLKVPVLTPILTLPADAFLGSLVVGDTVPVRIDHGWVQESGNRRVVSMTLRPGAEALDVVVN